MKELNINIKKRVNKVRILYYYIDRGTVSYANVNSVDSRSVDSRSIVLDSVDSIDNRSIDNRSIGKENRSINV